MGNIKQKTKPTLAKNIIARRKALGWNAHKLAEKAEVKFETLRDIETGKSGSRPNTRKKLAHALGCEEEDLFSKNPQEIKTANEIQLKEIKDHILDIKASLIKQSVDQVRQELIDLVMKLDQSKLSAVKFAIEQVCSNDDEAVLEDEDLLLEDVDVSKQKGS